MAPGAIMKREFYFQHTLNNEFCAVTLAAVRTAAFVWSLIGKTDLV